MEPDSAVLLRHLEQQISQIAACVGVPAPAEQPGAREQAFRVQISETGAADNSSQLNTTGDTSRADLEAGDATNYMVHSSVDHDRAEVEDLRASVHRLEKETEQMMEQKLELQTQLCQARSVNRKLVERQPRDELPHLPQPRPLSAPAARQRLRPMVSLPDMSVGVASRDSRPRSGTGGTRGLTEETGLCRLDGSHSQTLRQEQLRSSNTSTAPTAHNGHGGLAAQVQVLTASLADAEARAAHERDQNRMDRARIEAEASERLAKLQERIISEMHAIVTHGSVQRMPLTDGSCTESSLMQTQLDSTASTHVPPVNADVSSSKLTIRAESTKRTLSTSGSLVATPELSRPVSAPCLMPRMRPVLENSRRQLCNGQFQETRSRPRRVKHALPTETLVREEARQILQLRKCGSDSWERRKVEKQLRFTVNRSNNEQLWKDFRNIRAPACR